MRSNQDFWFRFNVGRFFVELRPRSPIGCVLILLLLLGFVALSIFLTIKIYSIVLPLIGKRLGLSAGWGIALLLISCLGARINLPFCLVFRDQASVRYEVFPIWLFKVKSSAYLARFRPQAFLGLNLAGGIVPLGLALYQFQRTSATAILAIAAIVTVISYFTVVVVPGIGIFCRRGLFWLTALAAALCALMMVGAGTDRPDVAAAFAGGVLGSTIGADLLHLKDLRLARARSSLSIGAAGLNDGIVLCGVYALLMTEWLPALSAWLGR